MVKRTFAPKKRSACDAAPMPKKLMCRIGLFVVRDWSSCWMRGISGGGVAAVSVLSLLPLVGGLALLPSFHG